MRLSSNDKVLTEAADAEALELALDGFQSCAKGCLELRSTTGNVLRATREKPGAYFLEVSQRGSCFGLTLKDKDIGQARAAFQEFFRGYTPKLPWKRLEIPGDGAEFIHIVGGTDYDDDCPLCRAGR